MHIPRYAVLLLIPVLVGACSVKTIPSPTASERNDNSQASDAKQRKIRPGEKPVPPLQLAVPAAQPGEVDGKNLKKMDQGELLARAYGAMGKQDYAKAADFQYWYVQKSKTGQYNLACFLAQIGEVDAAFYWLQLAGLEEGVDTQHALVDEDLVSLRRDPRWEKVHRYLEDCNNYFETANIKYTLVIVPKAYQKGKPIPAVVWMHGLGANPENFTNDGAQAYADELNIALIGVSGTKARGPRSFVWAEDTDQDARRLREALEEAKEKVTIEKGKVITFGFSQGAQMGLEVAVRYPEEYAGAIVLSPGARSHLNELTASPLLTKRGFVLCCGAQEHPGNVLLTSNDAAWLRRAKAQIIHKPYPGMSAHSFPPDFEDRFPEWIKFILNARGRD